MEGCSQCHSRERSWLWRGLESSKSRYAPTMQRHGVHGRAQLWARSCWQDPSAKAGAHTGVGTPGCSSGACRAVGTGGWLKEVGDGETEAELQRWGCCVLRAIGCCLCQSRHVARCIAEHPSPHGALAAAGRDSPSASGKKRPLHGGAYRGILLPGWPWLGRATVMCQGQAGRGAHGDEPRGCWH